MRRIAATERIKKRENENFIVIPYPVTPSILKILIQTALNPDRSIGATIRAIRIISLIRASDNHISP